MGKQHPKLKHDLPKDTSAAQLATWVVCPRKYLFRYVLKLEPESRSIKVALGFAVRSAIGWFFRERINRRSPRPEQAEATFEADLATELSECDVQWSTNAARDACRHGRLLVQGYLKKFSRLPVVAVDEPFRVSVEDPETRECLPRLLKGSFDLVLGDGAVVKLVTASRRAKHDLVRHLHLGAYVAAKCMQDGGPVEVAMHSLVAEPGIDVRETRFERGEPGNQWWFRAAQEIEQAILAGHFPPSPGALCADCEYGRRCEAWTGVAQDSLGASSRVHLQTA